MLLRTLYFSVLLLAAACNSHAQTPAAASSQPQSAPAPVTITSSPIANADPASSLHDALQLLRARKFAEAESAYKAILQTDPESSLAYVGLARLYLAQDHVADADVAASKAIAINPTSSTVRVAKGEVLFRQGRIVEAQDQFMPLVKVNTQEARAYFGLGLAYWAASYYRHAKLMFDMAYERDPDDPDIRSRWLFTEIHKEPIPPPASSPPRDTNGDDAAEKSPGSKLVVADEGVGFNTGCRMVSNASESHQPLQPMMYSAQRLTGYGLKVQIGAAKGTLLLDTGASGILIKRKLAEKAGIQSRFEAGISGIGDKAAAQGYMGIADSVKIGNLEFQHCLVHVDVSTSSSIIDEDGLIGADLFEHFLVDINFPDRKLDLTPLPPLPPPSDSEKALVGKYPKIARFHDRVIPPEFKSFTPVYRFHHMLLIPTQINELPSKLFLIDTGGFADTISPAAAREVTKVRSDYNFRVKGLSGNVNNVFTADELTLTFSHFKQPARDIAAFDTTGMSRSIGTEISGMLGFSMLRLMDIKIDYRDGLVDFAYDPNRLH